MCALCNRPWFRGSAQGAADSMGQQILPGETEMMHNLKDGKP